MRTALHTAKGYAPSADMKAAALCAYFGNPRRTLAEAAFLRDASEEDALLASRSASWRREATCALRSARRLLLEGED